ncbi:hypothetical protein TSTA_059870 [Talaromyces stipitatus ATCC 10500]|uniref:Uncharacterized protein n=1 Tax=Talaromyces stipitatus (strain ATCC 10500 / CBS 375.48 / QM 6759 / NRRL 1006) TaxID=441959 RepID=B8LTB5_TALSN|nr:uncharacterized protein TSTA_059870 [Talaromyces stipitatus ATCC 10500]EED22489.1 hypothetical protein TSTA_059870 [Talaromyces stipitatus ATCC 10500]
MKPLLGTLVLQSDITPLEISHVQAVRTVHQSKSVRTILDDDSSEDELTQPSIHEAPQEPTEPAQEADTLMTTNLEDSTWANNQLTAGNRGTRSRCISLVRARCKIMISWLSTYINKHTDPLTTYSLALKGSFHILLQPTPKEEYKKRPRVCFYVNRGLDPATWEVQYYNRDLSTLTLHTAAHGTIYIHNIYNLGVNSNKESVISALQTAMAPRV